MSDVERRDVLIGTLGLATAALAATEPAAAGDTSFMNNVPDPLLSGDDLPTFKCNAKGGTPLMQSVQTIGIDLPLKALVWQDASGNTWLSYNDPRWLAKRHGLGDEGDQALDAMAAALDAIAKAATSSCS